MSVVWNKCLLEHLSFFLFHQKITKFEHNPYTKQHVRFPCVEPNPPGSQLSFRIPSFHIIRSGKHKQVKSVRDTTPEIVSYSGSKINDARKEIICVKYDHKSNYS